MNKITSLALALSVAISAFATEPVVTVNPLEGEAYSEAISKVARVTFLSDVVALVASDGTVLYNYGPISSVRSVTFGAGESNAIAEIIDNHETKVSIVPEPATQSVRIEGLADGAPVLIYSISGAVVLRGAAPCVSLTSLSQGIYVIVAGDAAAKVTVK